VKREMICISCPIGCRLTVFWEDREELSGDDIRVEGNKCVRGEEYGKEEILAPKRVVTATCAICSRMTLRVPVKTNKPLIKRHIKGLLEEVYEMNLEPPIAMGDVIKSNIAGTKVDLVATRSVPQ
jgi:CxxC motif-containing protein